MSCLVCAGAGTSFQPCPECGKQTPPGITVEKLADCDGTRFEWCRCRRYGLAHVYEPGESCPPNGPVAAAFDERQP